MDGLVAGTLQRRSKGRSVRLSSRSRAPPRPEDLQCSAPARHSEDLPPKHSETQLPERLQNGCRITAPAYTHIATRSDSRLHSRRQRIGSPISRSRDARSPRPRTPRGARGISRASFSTAGARVPRAERRCNGDAVCGRARGTVLRPAPRVDRALSGPRLGVKSPGLRYFQCALSVNSPNGKSDIAGI